MELTSASYNRAMESERARSAPWRDERLAFLFSLSAPILLYADLAAANYLAPNSAILFLGFFLLLVCCLLSAGVALANLLYRLCYSRNRYILVWLGLLVLDLSPLAVILYFAPID